MTNDISSNDPISIKNDDPYPKHVFDDKTIFQIIPLKIAEYSFKNPDKETHVSIGIISYVDAYTKRYITKIDNERVFGFFERKISPQTEEMTRKTFVSHRYDPKNSGFDLGISFDICFCVTRTFDDYCDATDAPYRSTEEVALFQSNDDAKAFRDFKQKYFVSPTNEYTKNDMYEVMIRPFNGE